MTVLMRTGLGLLLVLLLLAAGSDQLQAQGTPGASGAEPPPPAAQRTPQMPPGGMNAGAENKKNFEQGDVKIAGEGEIDPDGVGVPESRSFGR